MHRLFRWMFSRRPQRPIRKVEHQRAVRARLRLEALEDRFVPAAPTLVNPGTIFVPAGQTINIPLDGFDADGDALSYTAVSDNANVTTSVPTGNPSLRIETTIDGVPQDALILQLFQDLTPNTVAHISNLVNNGFYDTRLFHRIIQDFVAQLGNSAANQPDNSTPTIADEYHADLTFNGFGQLAMANTGVDDSGSNQLFITDVDLSVGNTPESGKRPPQSLNFNHTIFGQLVQGFDALTNIIAKGGPAPNGVPTATVAITNADIFVDIENGVLRVKALNGFTGSANITVTVTDTNGDSSQQTFTVNVVPDTTDGTALGTAVNDRPFLGNIPNQNAVSGQPLQIQLTSTDIDAGDPRFFAVGGTSNFLSGGNLINNPTNAIVTLNQTTGILTVTPVFPFTGPLQLKIGVRDGAHGTDLAAFDTQIITINVAASTNALPVLNPLPDTFQAVSGTPLVIDLGFTDADAGDLHFFAAGSQANFLSGGNLINNPSNASVFIDQSTGKLTVTPTVGFTGQIELMVGVRDNAHGETSTAFDTQVVTINVVASESNPTSRVRENKLFIRGTELDDIITLELSQDGQSIIVKTSNGGTPRTFALNSINRIIIRTGAGNDQVTIGSSVVLRSRMTGGRGDDVFQAGGGDSIIRGNQGSDHLMGGAGKDRIKGGRGDDILEGFGGDDRLKGKLGNDMVMGGLGNDKARGGEGNDHVDGGAGSDHVVGMGGDDVVFGGVGADRVRGGKGENQYGPADNSDDHDGFRQGRDTRPGTFTDADLLGTRMDQLANAPTDTTGGRIQAGDIDYLSLGFENPPHIIPTYGPHHQTPIATGISATERLEEDVLANLDVGHIWITYDPQLIGDALPKLQSLVNGFGPNSGIVLSPRASQDVAIVVSSWARQSVLHTFDGDFIRRFIFANRAHGPTAFASA